jgi:hypothetical protein
MVNRVHSSRLPLVVTPFFEPGKTLDDVALQRHGPRPSIVRACQPFVRQRRRPIDCNSSNPAYAVDLCRRGTAAALGRWVESADSRAFAAFCGAMDGHCDTLEGAARTAEERRMVSRFAMDLSSLEGRFREICENEKSAEDLKPRLCVRDRARALVQTILDAFWCRAPDAASHHRSRT